MGAINKGIFQRLANDSTLTALLSTFEGEPAIFSIDTVPTDVTFPYITINEDLSAIPFDTKTKEGRDIVREIRCFTLATGSRITLDSIAERVRFLFHRKPDLTTMEGFEIIIIDVDGPKFTPTNERVFGVELEVRFVIQELGI